MPEAVLALCTVPADFDPRELARDLISRGLAACVTIVPSVRSVYRWEGTVEESVEQQLLIKTTRERVDALWLAVKALHPYDVPEFLVLPILTGNPDYLRWVSSD
jgi:periplasmic divalent cation tolerance protein